MHTYKVLYQDGKSIRRLVEVELPDAHQIIGVQRYTDFEEGKGGKENPNGTYPVILSDDFNSIYGKLLTLCDAAFTDNTQREAFKDMVKNNLSDWYNKNVDYVFAMSEQINNIK